MATPRRGAGHDDFRPWLYGIARNVLLTHRRGRHRRERLGALLLAAVEVQHPDTAQIVVDRDEYEGLIATFRSLSKSDRELFAVVSWDGLSPTESADPLQINPENNGAGPSPRPDESNGRPIA